MICLGTVYSWSMFTPPLVAMFQTSNTLAALTFGIAIFSIGWGAVAGARWERTAVGVAVAAPIFGLIVLSSGLGRLLWAAVAERFGVTIAFVAIALVQTAAFAVLASVHSREMLVTCFAIVLLCYGGCFGTMPLMCVGYFGPRFARLNYAMLLTAWGCAGLAGTLLGSIVRDVTGSFAGALLPVGVISLVAALVPLVTRKPSERISPVASSA